MQMALDLLSLPRGNGLPCCSVSPQLCPCGNRGRPPTARSSAAMAWCSPAGGLRLLGPSQDLRADHSPLHRQRDLDSLAPKLHTWWPGPVAKSRSPQRLVLDFREKEVDFTEGCIVLILGKKDYIICMFDNMTTF